MKAKETAKQFKYLVAMKLVDVIPICKLILTNAGIKITYRVYDTVCVGVHGLSGIVSDPKISRNCLTFRIQNLFLCASNW